MRRAECLREPCSDPGSRYCACMHLAGSRLIERLTDLDVGELQRTDTKIGRALSVVREAMQARRSTSSPARHARIEIKMVLEIIEAAGFNSDTIVRESKVYDAQESRAARQDGEHSPNGGKYGDRPTADYRLRGKR